MNKRKRLLLVAATTGYQIRVFEEAARRMGLDAVLATDRCHVLDDPWGDHAVPVRFEQPAESAAALAAEGPFDAVVAVGDRPTVVAALAARQLGLRYHTPESVEACRNKYAARERFRAAGMPAPVYYRVPLDADPAVEAARAPYPCVLKPLGLSASRGVIRANDAGEFAAAFGRIRRILEMPEIRRYRDQQDRYLQVESFIEGREFALDGLVTDGQLCTLALFDKPDPLDGPYFEETIYVTPSREPAGTQAELIAAAGQAVGALGLTQGPVHAEMRHNARGVWMLEVAARPIGGLCARALRFNGGAPLEELVLRHALGEDVEAVRLDGPASGVMMIPIPNAGVYAGVEGEDRAREVAGIQDVMITAKPGQDVAPLPEGSTYLGFIFARGATPEFVENALRAAHSQLRFEIVSALPVVGARTRRG